MAFLSRWQRGGRADSEGHGDAEKEKKKVFELDSRHSSLPASFYDEIFSFFQYWFICILCVLDIAVWLQGRLFGKEEEKNFFFFFFSKNYCQGASESEREKKTKKRTRNRQAENLCCVPVSYCKLRLTCMHEASVTAKSKEMLLN